MITIQEKLSMREARILIASVLHLELSDQIHQGHQVSSNCRKRAKQFVRLLGLSKQIGDVVNNCRMCCQNHKIPVGLLVQSKRLQHLWRIIAPDVSECKHSKYLLFVDLHSHYIVLYRDNGPFSSPTYQFGSHFC